MKTEFPPTVRSTLRQDIFPSLLVFGAGFAARFCRIFDIYVLCVLLYIEVVNNAFALNICINGNIVVYNYLIFPLLNSY